MTDIGLSAFCEGVCDNNGLIAIDLSNNNVTEQSAAALLAALSTNTGNDCAFLSHPHHLFRRDSLTQDAWHAAQYRNAGKAGHSSAIAKRVETKKHPIALNNGDGWFRLVLDVAVNDVVYEQRCL